MGQKRPGPQRSRQRCEPAFFKYSKTPSLRSPEFQDEDDDSLSDVAFCARWLAVLSASEVGRTKRPHEHSGLGPLSDRAKPLHGAISMTVILWGPPEPLYTLLLLT